MYQSSFPVINGLLNGIGCIGTLGSPRAHSAHGRAVVAPIYERESQIKVAKIVEPHSLPSSASVKSQGAVRTKTSKAPRSACSFDSPRFWSSPNSSAMRAAIGRNLPRGIRTNHIGRTLHTAKVHSGQVFADYAEGEELRTGENSDDRREKRKAGDAGAGDKVAANDPAEYKHAQEGKREADEAGELEGNGGEAGHH